MGPPREMPAQVVARLRPAEPPPHRWPELLGRLAPGSAAHHPRGVSLPLGPGYGSGSAHLTCDSGHD
jgi:hypothetical protein